MRVNIMGVFLVFAIILFIIWLACWLLVHTPVVHILLFLALLSLAMHLLRASRKPNVT
jgi:hypothetical protein